MMKKRTLKKQAKKAMAKVANLALGYVPNAIYGDLYRAISNAETVLDRLTGTPDKKLVLFGHKHLIEMQEVRELAWKKAF